MSSTAGRIRIRAWRRSRATTRSAGIGVGAAVSGVAASLICPLIPQVGDVSCGDRLGLTVLTVSDHEPAVAIEPLCETDELAIAGQLHAHLGAEGAADGRDPIGDPAGGGVRARLRERAHERQEAAEV